LDHTGTCAPAQRPTNHEQAEGADAGIAETIQRIRLQGSGPGQPSRSVLTDEQSGINRQDDPENSLLVAT